jgi:UDP-N-acetylmuramate dehydrogenase
VIESVRVLGANGEFEDLARADCSPSYRNGNLGGRILVGAVMRFEPVPVPLVKERMREYLVAKNAVQPVTQWSAGCIFKNPDPELSDGRSAGKLVDDCGGKELARGDAAQRRLDHARL